MLKTPTVVSNHRKHGFLLARNRAIVEVTVFDVQNGLLSPRRVVSTCVNRSDALKRVVKLFDGIFSGISSVNYSDGFYH